MPTITIGHIWKGRTAVTPDAIMRLVTTQLRETRRFTNVAGRVIDNVVMIDVRDDGGNQYSFTGFRQVVGRVHGRPPSESIAVSAYPVELEDPDVTERIRRNSSYGKGGDSE